MSHLFISTIQTHKSHFISANHALEWLPFHQVWQPFGRPEDALKGCITFIDANQRAYLSMKTGLDRGSSNDLRFFCKSRLFWLCATQPSFPPLPIPSLMEAKLQFSSGFLCVCRLISAPLFPFSTTIIISPDTEKQPWCAASLCPCIYLCIYLSVCQYLPVSVCLFFLSVCFFVLSIFLSVPFLFLVSLITNTHTQGTATQV